MKAPLLPTRIDKHSTTQMFVSWNTGEKFIFPYLELRFHCPCASCVDEITGKRVLRRGSLKPDIRPLQVELVGKYAVQVTWSDGHRTGMFSFDRLYDFCQQNGIPQP